jgi:hypothetical protein
LELYREIADDLDDPARLERIEAAIQGLSPN